MHIHVNLHGFDYEELVAKREIVRAMTVVVTTKVWILHHVDVKNAFLHGDLQKEVFMD